MRGSYTTSSPENNQLLSCALDGKAILWTVDGAAQSLTPKRIYLLKAEHLPKTLKVGIDCIHNTGLGNL